MGGVGKFIATNIRSFALESTLNLKPLVVLGGTFDPVHLGHIKIAKSICERFNINEVCLMPDYQPVHRDRPQASSAQRLEMLKLVCDQYSHLVVDQREISRKGPSYSYLSVKEIRQEIGDKRPFYFVLGSDALSLFDHWFRWSELLSYCHLLVASRPGDVEQCSPQLQNYLLQKQQSIDNISTSFGSVAYLNNDLSKESSTEIRRRLSQQQSITNFVTTDVALYIQKQDLY